MKKVKHMFLNYSTYESYMTCPRKMAWASVENLVTAEESDESLAARWKGTLVHKCIDAAYSGRMWETVFNDELSKVEAIHEIAPDKSGSVAHLGKLIESYMAHYSVPNDPAFQITATERRMEMPVNDWLTLVGTIDKSAIKSVDNTLTIIDHKTSSSIKAFLAPTIPVSDQFTAYLALCKANGFNAESVIVDGISTAKKALDDGEGLFVRFETRRTDWQIAEFITRFAFQASRMKDDIENGTFTTRQGKACFDFNSKCQFYDACVTGSAENRANVLKNSFKTQLDENPSFRIIYE